MEKQIREEGKKEENLERNNEVKPKHKQDIKLRRIRMSMQDR